MAFLALIVVAIIALILTQYGRLRFTADDIKRFLRGGLSVIAPILFIMLLFSGQFLMLIGFLAVVITLLLLLGAGSIIAALFSGSLVETMAGVAGGISRFGSRFLILEMDGTTGAVTGVIRDGLYAGKPLESLSEESLQELLRYYAENDPPSLSLLQAFIARQNQTRNGEASSRNYGGQGHNSQSNTQGSNRGNKSRSTTQMSHEEALAILGLEEGADKAAITIAYKRLMAKMHPDQGGTTYLAAQINAARETLLG